MNREGKQKRRGRRKWFVPAGIAVLGVVVALALWLWAGEQRVRPRHILLISIDTCRADYLSCYGYARPTTPHIDALAAAGVLFRNALTPVPLTLPGHISMLTGTIPPTHGIRDNHDHSLDESLVTLAEILQANGFATGAVVGAFVLDSAAGLAQGFDSYDDTFQQAHKAVSIAERKADEGSRVAIEWLDQHKDEKFFLFLHFFDPHNPYKPPEPFASRFADSPYAGEVAFVDHCIGQVIAKLQAENLYDSTLIVLTSDHGEMLGEHQEGSHGFFIYQSALHVPLIVKPAGSTKPRVIEDLVGIIDIPPTICSMVGIEPLRPAAGLDLSAYCQTGTSARRHTELYCETLYPVKYNVGINPLLGIVTADHFKYIKTTRPELYDLSKDRQEKNNLIKVEAKRARRLDGILTEILETQTRSKSGQEAPLDAKALKQLEGLGYVGGVVKEAFVDPDGKDPKDYIQMNTQYARIHSLIDLGNYELAEHICRAILQQEPRFYLAYHQLGRMAREKNNLAATAGYWRKSVQLVPDDFDTQRGLAEVLVELGELEESIAPFRKALELAPNDFALGNNLGATLARLERFEEAAVWFQKAFDADPLSNEAQINLLRVLIATDKMEAAQSCVGKIAELAPDQSAVAYNDFASLLGQAQKLDLAITHFEKALQIDPDYLRARHNLAQTLARLGKVDEAIAHFQALTGAMPENFHWHNQLGMLYLQQKAYDQAKIHLTQSLQHQGDQPDVLYRLGQLARAENDPAAAVDYWQRSWKLQPDSVSVLNALAWVWATCSEPALRRPAESVKLATRACELTGFANPSLLDTLAAAQAAAGDFPQAVKTAEKALQLARESQDAKAITRIETHLQLYQSDQPLVEPPR